MTDGPTIRYVMNSRAGQYEKTVRFRTVYDMECYERSFELFAIKGLTIAKRTVVDDKKEEE